MAHKKLPMFQVYTGDWMKDPRLSKCEPATRGIWFDMLCAMHEDDRSGVVSGTANQLSRACRCSPSELISAVSELEQTETATVTRNGKVTDCHTIITVRNRRMERERKERVASALRQSRHRDKRKNTPKVTTPLSSSSSPSSSKETPQPPVRIGEKPTAEESEAAGKILAILQGTEYWGKHQQGAIVLAHLENLCQAYGAPKLLELMHWYASNHTDRYTPNLTSLESLAAGIPKLLAARDRTADEQAAEAQDLPACKLW